MIGAPHPDCPWATLRTRSGSVGYVPLHDAAPGADRLPVTTRILLEMRLRHGGPGAADDLSGPTPRFLPFQPGRVICQDHSGLPALADLAAMRARLHRYGRPPRSVDPVLPVDLVIDHSVEAHAAGHPGALGANTAREYAQNGERYTFLRWAGGAFTNLRIVPPGRGIIHQVHLEHLARVVAVGHHDGVPYAYPDTVVGTDSHTPMVNALGVLGFGVGGIEAAAAMLGQPIPLTLSAVVGVRLTGALSPHVTATDLALSLTERLRERHVVGAFLEFFGDGVARLGAQDRATVANMCPEYGATCALFPVDDTTLDYLRVTRRDADLVDLVERYTKEQGLFAGAGVGERLFSDVIEVDLDDVEPCVAGPHRPYERLRISEVPASLPAGPGGTDGAVADGAVAIAAITSCTNTSNPGSILAAGILARNAARRGLRPPPWVKTSLAPGSRAVSRYLADTGLDRSLEALGFHVVGYGCTTCIGNSGPLTEPAARAAGEGRVLAAVLSGNRNFEGRIHPDVQAAYLASPPLVVAWALAGTVHRDLTREPLGHDPHGRPVLLADLWPAPGEVDALLGVSSRSQVFGETYSGLFDGDERWNALPAPAGDLFPWDPASTYLVEPPFLAGVGVRPLGDVHGARVLVAAGDAVTTDHISPAGAIPARSEAGRHLLEHGVARDALGTYGGRRGNHDVLVRGTFANPRLRNRLASRPGGWTRLLPDGDEMTVHEAATRYAARGVPLVVLAGRNYGMGSSRDWAAKGPRLLGVVAVLASGFERIHRSNLIGMGIVPVVLPDVPEALGLTGEEEYDLLGLDDLCPGGPVTIVVRPADGPARRLTATAAIGAPLELDYLRHGGVLPRALGDLAAVRP